MRLPKRDQMLLAEAYGVVYLEEGLLPDNIKSKIDNFTKQYGRQIVDFIQKKFPDFYEQLAATGGDQAAIENLVKPLVQNQNTQGQVQEGFMDVARTAVDKSKGILSKLFSYNSLGQALLAIGTASLALGDAQVKGSGIDNDLLIMGIVAILTGIYGLYIDYKDNKNTPQ